MNKTIISVIILILVVILATSIGSYPVTFVEVVKVFLFKLGFEVNGITDTMVSIIWNIRFPRVLLALFVGGALSVSGMIAQSLFKNPLASPYTLGVSSGASLGVALVIMFGLTGVMGQLTISVAAIIGSLLTILLVLSLANRIDKAISNTTVVLTGLVISLFLNAFITTIMALNKEGLENIVRFSMGSLALKGWTYVYIIIPFVLIALVVGFLYHKELDILTFGEENAKTLGIDVKKVKIRLIVLASILTGSAIAVSGVIGFIGLVTPHIVRRIFGPLHKLNIWMNFIFGGIFLIFADMVARTIISPSELPVGAITAFIGGPFFLYVFFWRKS